MKTGSTRRELLAQGLGLLAGGVTTAAVAAQNEDRDRLPVIDTHVHLWELDRFRLPWITAESPLRRDYTIRDYLEATRGCNVVKAVYMEVDVDPAQQLAEAEWISGVCQRGDTPLRAAVVSGRPAADDFGDYVRRFRDHRYVKGLREVLHSARTPAGTCTRPEYVRGVRLLGQLGLTFDLCLRHAELGDGGRLAQACPDTRFVLDHCGNPDVQARDRTAWRRDLERLARQRNVMCKVSGIPSSAPRDWTAETFAPIVNHVLDSFGPDRVLFAADWPVCTRTASFRQWLDAVKAIVRDRPAGQQRKLFHDNAARLYGL